MRIGLLLLCGLAFTLKAQQDPADLLLRVRQRVIHSINRLPKYMCTQTIDRLRYVAAKPKQHFTCDDGPTPKDLRLVTSDRLRFDVGMTGAGEIYSWAGANRFDDRSLFDLVNEGAISNGVFAAYLTAIFQDDGASFSYDGDITEAGRLLSKFGFRVPVEKSHNMFSNGRVTVTTAYAGDVLVDPSTSDLVRLEVHTVGLPPETGSCLSSTTLDYERVHLKDSEFLLPTTVHLEIRDINGAKADNRTVFSNCHEFLGESTLSFDLPPDAAAVGSAPAAAPAALALPEGARFTVSTTQDIAAATAAAGDAVQAKLTTAIVGADKAVLAPAGAVITARLLRVRQFLGGVRSVSLALKLEAIEINGVSVSLHAKPNFAFRAFSAGRGSIPQRMELGTLSDLKDRDAVVFEIQNVQLQPVIKRGLESSWMIYEPAPVIKNILVPGKE